MVEITDEMMSEARERGVAALRGKSDIEVYVVMMTTLQDTRRKFPDITGREFAVCALEVFKACREAARQDAIQSLTVIGIQ